MPASFFIQQRIITEAKRLLVYTQLTTVEISHTLGFKDTSYFCRYFKRETDLSPLTFRSSYREKYHTHPAKSLQY
jgi:AraC-like DNA-binding protein